MSLFLIRLMKTSILFTAVFVLLFQNSKAQDDYSWWNEIHQWDGHTPWNQYMTISTSFFGPNALPVPEVKKGNLSEELEFEIAGGLHFGAGDKTQDFFTRLYIPLAEGKVAIEGFLVPLEFFEMDTVTRDERAARTKSGKGHAGGDIYISTQIQLLEDKEKWPDIALELAFRTASGTRLSDARFTDGPGYYMDFSFGKSIALAEERDIELRLYLMLGLYVYQTYDLEHLQNDAWMEGVGAELNFKKFSLSQTLSGYQGYLDIGDKPLNYKASLNWKGRKFDAKLWYQLGLNDYPYQSLRAGVIYHIAL